MKKILSELRPAVAATLVLAGVTCGVYPLFVTTVAQAAFKHQATGSLITDPDGKVRGSRLIGQTFTSSHYFHSRPSAAGSGYDAASSGGSNLGPTSQKLHDQVKERIVAYRTTNGVPNDLPIPADAVTASASGLDPHISIANVDLQSARVAKARSLPLEKVKALVQASTESPDFGMLGETRVNVLRLNQSLDTVK